MATIRLISADEGMALRDIRLRAIKDSPTAFGSSMADTLARSDDAWTDWATSGAEATSRALYIAEADGRWVGIAGGVLECSQQSAALISMWVEPTQRGHGLGLQLVERIIGWAQQRGARRLELWVTAGNAAAAALYARAGFIATGATEPLRSNPALSVVQMVLELGAIEQRRGAGRT